jgi:hypothetical protein
MLYIKRMKIVIFPNRIGIRLYKKRIVVNNGLVIANIRPHVNTHKYIEEQKKKKNCF